MMSKLLTSTLIASIALSANTVPDNKVLVKYVKRNIVKNPKVTVEGVTVLEQKTHKDLPGWTVLLTTMDLKYEGKTVHAPETMFVKGNLITGHLVNQRTGNDYRGEIKPTVPKSMYDDKHLLFGNKNAKHKILVFSDPQCPFCMELVPEIMKAAKNNPDKIALYYYHLPLLRIHPVSGELTKIMHLAQEQGKKDVVLKMYSLKIDPRETNSDKIIAAVKKHTGFVVTKDQLNTKDVENALKADENAASKLMVTGTPTVYIDGHWDKMRTGFEKLIK
ncbi:Secreted protein, suppressor for copper-sensitivity ScsC [hydrothermal vent metagenome]|uniref:Secreted protein, suppressor for copper-sensitivity ScsC n=1 Tax=hydrothermal vent metagenome TaxID=652676 RepID=A0A1W1EE69_9ZZZZ